MTTKQAQQELREAKSFHIKSGTIASRQTIILLEILLRLISIDESLPDSSRY